MRIIHAFSTTAAIVSFVSLAASQQYTVTNLGSLTGLPSPSPSAINNLGQMTGDSSSSDFSVTHPFRTSPNSAINPATDDLGLLPGATPGTATGINNLGHSLERPLVIPISAAALSALIPEMPL